MESQGSLPWTRVGPLPVALIGDTQNQSVPPRITIPNSAVSMTYEERTIFFEQLLQKLHVLLDNETKADVLVMLGRTDKTTGEKIPPQVQVREFGL